MDYFDFWKKDQKLRNVGAYIPFATGYIPIPVICPDQSRQVS
jgi:hypothetical protein